MTLPIASGSISLGQINIELGRSPTAPVDLNDALVRRTLAKPKPNTTISLEDAYGKQYQMFLELSNANNVDLMELALANGWDGSAQINVVIPSGITISSTSPDTAALTIAGYFPNKVWLTNNGTIRGAPGVSGVEGLPGKPGENGAPGIVGAPGINAAAGAGGAGGAVYPSPGAPGSAASLPGPGGKGGQGGKGGPGGKGGKGGRGGKGGVALVVGTALHIHNNGAICGGLGGKGGPGGKGGQGGKGGPGGKGGKGGRGAGGGGGASGSGFYTIGKEVIYINSAAGGDGAMATHPMVNGENNGFVQGGQGGNFGLSGAPGQTWIADGGIGGAGSADGANGEDGIFGEDGDLGEPGNVGEPGEQGNAVSGSKYVTWGNIGTLSGDTL